MRRSFGVSGRVKIWRRREVRRVVLRLGLACAATGGVLAAVAVPAAAAAPATYYAAPSAVGSGNCSDPADACTLATAITDANTDNDGDTIMLAGGTYAGFLPTITGSMTLQAESGASPILNAEGLSVSSGSVAVNGLTVQNAQLAIVVSGGSLTVSDSTITNNHARAISNEGSGMVTVSDSTITDSGGADGIANEGSGSVTVSDSTIAGNDSYGVVIGEGSVTVSNSTITGNGGGIGNSGGSVTVSDSTITDNNLGNFYGGGIGITNNDGGSVTAAGDIVAGNANGDCVGSVSDGGGNIDSDGSCGFSTTNGSVSQSSKIVGSLEPLGNYGGPTQTIALSQGSPAIGLVSPGVMVPDPSDPTGAEVSACSLGDQRGDSRPGMSGASNCDAGAFEWYAPTSLIQGSPTSGTVAAGTAYAGQLSVTNPESQTGPVSFTTTSGSSPVTVSVTGAVSAPSSTPAGTYTVSGTDGDNIGDSGTWSFTLSIAGPPTITLTTPSQGASYTQGQKVTASYSCAEGTGGPGLLAGMSGCSGTVPSGSAVPTSQLGSQSFTVTATSQDGQSTTETVTYTVQSASKLADVSVGLSGPKSAADGTSFSEMVTVKNAGPATAGDVVTVLTIPSGVSVTSTGSGTDILGTVLWTAAQIAPGATASYTVTFKVNAKASGIALVGAAAASLTNPDPDYLNNVAAATVALGGGSQAHTARELRTRQAFPANRRLVARLLALTHPRRTAHRSTKHRR